MRAGHFYRQSYAEIDLSALRFNVGQLQKKIGPHCAIMAVIKANAYGHGDVPIARALEKMGISFLAVAFLEEGIRLREQGIDAQLVILTGGQDPKYFKELMKYRLTPVFYDLDYLTAYNQFCRKRNKRGKVHLKFDTGMNRLGFSITRSDQVLEKLADFKNIKFEGIMTHFANAERPSHHNQQQIRRFTAIRKASPVKFDYSHLANSGAILNDFGVNENMVRPGLTLYGGYPVSALKSKLPLHPVMAIKSEVIQLKAVQRGDAISYGYTHRFVKDTVVATIPVGYADGFTRFFSNKGEVLIGGRRASIVGVVCMDVFMVDIGHIPDVSLGDEVVLMGAQKGESISVEDLAERIGSIPWEILCGISSRMPRGMKRQDPAA